MLFGEFCLKPAFEGVLSSVYGKFVGQSWAERYLLLPLPLDGFSRPDILIFRGVMSSSCM